MQHPSHRFRRFSVGFVVTALSLLVALPSCAQPPTPARLFEVLDGAWIEHESWYDGTAEVHLYDSTLVKYGQPRVADEVAHIFVTESHDPELLVKADDWRRPGLVPMLKLNYVVSVQTGVYRYEQMLSFFFDRRDLQLAKMTLSSHEWCGNTFKELVRFADRESFEFNTYWDGQGNGSFAVDFPEDLVVYDSLPGQLRALRFAEGLTASFPLLPSQLSSQVQPLVWSDATLRVTGRGEVDVPAGTFDAWTVELAHAGGTDTLVFEAAFPQRMVSWQQASGDSFRLKTSEKMAYWDKSGVGDEGLLRDGPGSGSTSPL